MSALGNNLNRIKDFAAEQVGGHIGDDQDGDSLRDDILQAVLGGAVTAALAGSSARAFAPTALAAAADNLNRAIDNHETKLLDMHVPNNTVQAAVKTSTGAAQTNLAAASVPGNLIMGAVKGALTPVENITGYKNAAIENAQKLLESVKTNN